MISIEHYAEKPQEAIKDAVKSEANIETAIEKVDNKTENTPKSFKDILEQNDNRAEAINAARQAAMMAQSKDQNELWILSITTPAVGTEGEEN